MMTSLGPHTKRPKSTSVAIRSNPSNVDSFCAVGTLAVKPLVALFLVVIPLAHLRKSGDAKCNGNYKNAMVLAHWKPGDNSETVVHRLATLHLSHSCLTIDVGPKLCRTARRPFVTETRARQLCCFKVLAGIMEWIKLAK
jgi:hypothetical protein